MKESALVLDRFQDIIYEHLPKGRTGGSLPDSRELWIFLLHKKDLISGVAHSHPGAGVPGPSWEDLTTFSAVERALGVRWDWWIQTTDQLALFRWTGPGIYDYGTQLRVHCSGLQWPNWSARLDDLSTEF